MIFAKFIKVFEKLPAWLSFDFYQSQSVTKTKQNPQKIENDEDSVIFSMILTCECLKKLNVSKNGVVRKNWY